MPDDKKIFYYFCLNSPFVYLGHGRLHEIAKKHGARIVYRPIDFRELMIRLLGTDEAPERSEAHKKYGKQELQRWADHYGIPIVLSPEAYSTSQQLAAKAAIAAERMGADPSILAFALPRAIWAQNRSINDEANLIAIANECGLPGEAIVSAARRDKAIAEELEMNTEEALKYDVFGIPTYCYGDLLLWGQDRLDFLDRALAAG